MFNQVILIGKIQEIKPLKQSVNGFKFLELVVSVERNYKNNRNEYDCDNIKCILWEGLSRELPTMNNYHQLTVSLKGRLQAPIHLNTQETTYYSPEIVIEKISIF